MTHLFSCLVKNKSGVLAQIAGLFAARGYNIDSLTVSPLDDPRYSRMTIQTHGDDNVIEQIHKQLDKLIDVMKVNDLSGKDVVDRELMLIKLNAPTARRSEILQLAEVFKAGVVDIGPKHVMLEVSGPRGKLDAIVEIMQPFGVKEMARSGRVTIARGV